MKLSIMLSVGVCASVLAYNAYSLTCGAQPSCSSLGYTYSGSTTDCLNTPLKCPFNTSYFNCVKKADVFSMLRVNWYSSTSLTAKSTYTVPKPGIIIGQAQDIGNYGSFITINSKKIGSLSGTAKQRSLIYANVYTGDRVYIDAQDIKVYFLPYYGS